MFNEVYYVYKGGEYLTRTGDWSMHIYDAKLMSKVDAEVRADELRGVCRSYPLIGQNQLDILCHILQGSAVTCMFHVTIYHNDELVRKAVEEGYKHLGASEKAELYEVAEYILFNN